MLVAGILLALVGCVSASPLQLLADGCEVNGKDLSPLESGTDYVFNDTVAGFTYRVRRGWRAVLAAR